MVHAYLQHMIISPELPEQESDERWAAQVERAFRFAARPAANLRELLVGRQMAEIYYRPRQIRPCGKDWAHRIAANFKASPQRFMALQQALQTPPQRDDLQSAAQPQSQRYVVGRAGAFELLQRPQLMLRLRDLQVPLTRHRR